MQNRYLKTIARGLFPICPSVGSPTSHALFVFVEIYKLFLVFPPQERKDRAFLQAQGVFLDPIAVRSRMVYPMIGTNADWSVGHSRTCQERKSCRAVAGPHKGPQPTFHSRT